MIDRIRARSSRAVVRGAALSTLGLASLCAVAADGPERKWTVGIGVPYDGSTYIDHESKLPVFPLVSWNSGRFSVSPFGLDVRLYDSEDRAEPSAGGVGNLPEAADGEPIADTADDIAVQGVEAAMEDERAEGEGEGRGPAWTFALSGGVDIGFGKRGKSESPAFEDRETRRNETTLGLGADIGTPLGSVVAGFRQDVSNSSGGFVADVAYGGPLFFEGGFVALFNVGVEYRDESHVDYFYGVRAGEVRAGRPAHAPGASTSPWIGYTMIYPVSPRWKLLHTLRVLDLDEAIVDSPLTTDDDREVQAVLLSTWSF